MRQLLDFFIIGVQKGGTTALAAYLRRHPGLQLSRDKEVHHFDDETRVDWSAPDHARLHAQFDWSVDNVLRGEATPITIYWPPSLSRLRLYNPQARLIVALRHPAFRAFSHWRMERARKLDDMPFEQAVSAEGRARVARSPGGAHRVFSYVERGFYGMQIERLLTHFRRDRIHFLRTDRLWADTAATLTAIERFLGVEAILGKDARQQYIVPIDTGSLGAPPRDVRAGLDDVFADDIRRTAVLTQLDLSDWLDPGYREPMRAGGD